MTRRRSSARGILLLAALGGTLGNCAEPGRPAVELPLRPIVVVTIDTLRADRLGTYGYGRDTSPVLDGLARQGTTFERAVTTMSTTLPAHTSLWTSLLPIETGVVANGTKYNVGTERRIRFFAEMLRDIGYQTAAFVSATPLKSRTGIAQGFALYDEPEVTQRSATETTDRVLAWLAAEPAEPFFLWVHYFDPHIPYEPPAPYDTMFSADEEMIDHLRQLRFPYPEDEEILRINDLYDGEVRYVDSELGRLFAELDAMGCFDDSTIVVTSDHGEGLGQHDWLQHGRIFNEQLLVPLIIKFPESAGLAGRRFSGLTSIVDLVPTLVAALDLPFDEADRQQLRGYDALSGARRYALSQRTVRPNLRLWGLGKRYSLQSERWKYLLATEGEDVLYDLERDEAEVENVIGRYPRQARKMREELTAILVERSAATPALAVTEELSPDVIEELRSLGYLN